MSVKPIIYSISPFDATRDFTVNFIYTYSQIFGRHVWIRNNSTNALVYEFTSTPATADRMEQRHIIPANTLANGVVYNVSLAVIDNKGVQSAISNVVIFSCYSTPVVKFTNINNNDILDSQNYTFNLSYSQAENIELDSYVIELYDYTKTNLLHTTEIKYDGALSTTINGLTNNDSYYIRGNVETINGISATTGWIYFTINTSSPEVYSVVSLTNIPEEASVKIDTHYILIEGKSADTLTYLDGIVDLTGGKVVTFDEGFLIKKNFTLITPMSDMNENTIIGHISSDEISAVLYWRKGDFGSGLKNYLEMVIETKITPTYSMKDIWQSNKIDILNAGEQVIIFIQRIDKDYNLKIKKVVSV